MSDVLDELEAAISAFPRPGASVPTPAVPLERMRDDEAELQRPIALAAIRRCLGAQEAGPVRSRIGRMLGSDPLSTESRRWYRAASDDLALAAGLQNGAWTVVHSVPIGKGDGDVDHVIVGSFGAVALLTVDAAEGRIEIVDGELHVDGVPTRDLDRAVEVREDVASRLGVAVGHEVPVASVVVVLGRGAVAVDGRPPVLVLTPRQLHHWLWRREAVLTAEETAQLAAAARRAGVWRDRSAVDPAQDPELAATFADLGVEVHRARRRRALWESLGLGAVLAVLVAVATGAPAALVDAVSSLGG